MAKRETAVCIVGCGAAGVTAAIGLARRKIPVMVVEGAPYPGAENWSGAVYFCENLVRPEILGEDLLTQTPLERRVVKRGVLLTDGRVAPGLSVRSRAAFEHCYTVLRPIFDHDLAEKARLLGAEILTGTQALGLIRDGDRIRGVLTDRGPIHADVVFLAEGDASNLVTREGLETKVPGQDGLVRPAFLQGVKEVLELPAGEIEKRFGVSSGEGAAYEILLRNGYIDGAAVPLNAGAFLYTNRESLSIGFVAPLENLAQWPGPHNRIVEWLKALPAVAPLLEGARPVSFGAKVIRGGGWKEMPRLALDGLAVGGAASGIGVDFPCPNYTGPATFMGYAFSEAVGKIAATGGSFDRAAIEEHYVARVQESVYCDDVHHLRDWPEYIGATRELFSRSVDLGATCAHVLTSPETGVFGRHLLAARSFYQTLSPGRIKGFLRDNRQSRLALGLTGGGLAELPRLVLWWTLNLVLGWFPRRNRSGATLVPELWHDSAPRRRLPLLVRYLRWRLAPGLAEALFQLYRNDGTPLREKMPLLRRAILTRLSWLDVLLLPLGALIVWITGAACAGVARWRARRPADAPESAAAPGAYARLLSEARLLRDLGRVRDAVDHDRKLAAITYRSDPHSHIHFHLATDARGLPDDAGSALFHVCPAKVYEAEDDAARGVSVAVLHENCIRCETCWRTDDRHVDWGRTRGHELVFETYSSADAWLAESQEAAALARLEPLMIEDEEEATADAATSAESERSAVTLPEETGAVVERHLVAARSHARAFLDLSRSLPGVVSGGDQDLLARLATVAFEAVQAAEEQVEAATSNAGVHERVEALRAWRNLATPRIASQRFFHLEADFLLFEGHHLPDLLQRCGLELPPLKPAPNPATARRSAVRHLLDEQLHRDLVLACESELAPTRAARALILRLARSLAEAGRPEPRRPGSPARATVLEELARHSPSLAAVLARHLLAADLLHRCRLEERDPDSLEEVRGELDRQRLLVGVVEGSFEIDETGQWFGTVPGALLGGVDLILVTEGTQIAVFAPGDDGVEGAVEGAIGLRGAGPGTLTLEAAAPRAVFSGEGIETWCRTRAPLDIVAMARGMAGYLAERAFDHATSRVQFPGLFRDLRGRDGLAKFGAVQEMLSGITQSLEILEGLRGRVVHGRTAAALAVDLLGCSPRSISYLTGQVFGGTAYSEEDPVCRFYRDASALRRMPYRLAESFEIHGRRVLKALHPGTAELPDLDLTIREIEDAAHWSPLIGRWTEGVRDAVRTLSRALRDLDAPLREALLADLGRAALQVGAVRLLARRAQDAFDRGVTDGVVLGALEAFASRVAARLRRIATRAPDTGRVMELGRLLLDRAAVEGPTGAAGTTYGDYLTDGSSFASGDLFLKPGSAAQLLYTPELLEADPELSAHRLQTMATFRERYRQRRFDGLTYPRFVEREHHVPLEDIAFLLESGYFRMITAEEHGGLDRKKAAYYVACEAMMREADPTQAIIVMGSTSIGTMPILFGLQQDLPAAKSSLQGLVDDPSKVEALERDVADILRRSHTPELPDLGKPTAKLVAQVTRGLKRIKAARPAFREFEEAVLAAGAAAGNHDVPAFRAALQQARDAFAGWPDRVQAELARLPGRERAHRFFLRLIAAGHISAFALTEPSAGSDTARVRTRAELREIEVFLDPRGFYTFSPDGGASRRNLFAYDAFEFEAEGLRFIRSDRTRIDVAIQDFAYDRPPGEEARFRYVVLDDERVDIHDIGRVEKRGGRYFYRYYAVSGAKMWITNAAMAGVMILYARTEEGVSGFMLDAHAEGITVGRDEHKMGQRGAATNELALDEVRIGVDQVIGIEGRGQENALETLNVGRAGLAICNVGLMHEVVDEVRQGLVGSDPTPLQLYDLGKMALDLVSSESLSYALVGLTDHGGTRSLRLESALAKARSSEALHRVISRAEQILDAEWALDRHGLEKQRRDARVITIYEGANEIQRFLVARDLVDQLDLDALRTGGVDGESAEIAAVRQRLDEGRGTVARRIRELREALGAQAWLQASLQPMVFSLVETLFHCSALGVTLHRLALARRLVDGERGRARLQLLEQVTDLLAEDLPRTERLLCARFDADDRRRREGRDPLHQVVADRAILRHEERPAVAASAAPRSRIDELLRVAVVLDPLPVLAPRPRIVDGRLREHFFELSPRERGVLQAALALKGAGPVELTVIGIGSVEAVGVMTEVSALGADHVFLLDKGRRALLAPDVAVDVAAMMRTREDLQEGAFDLVLGCEADGGFLTPLARRLDLVPISAVGAFGVSRDGEGQVLELDLVRPAVRLQHRGPALLLVDREVAPEDFAFTIAAWRRARRGAVSVIDLKSTQAPQLTLSLPLSSGNGKARPAGESEELSVDAAAALLAKEAGIAPGETGSGPYAGAVDIMTAGEFLSGLGALAVGRADVSGEVPQGLMAAAVAAASPALARHGVPGVLVLLASAEDAAARQAAGALRLAAPGARIAVLAHEDLGQLSPLQGAQLLEGLLAEHGAPVIFATEIRQEALLAGEGLSLGRERPVLVDGVDSVEHDGDRPVISGLRYDGKARFHVTPPGEGEALYLVARPDLHVADGVPVRKPADGRVGLLSDVAFPDGPDDLGRALREAMAATGIESLAEAEFIIDVGYGVGSRDGIEEVIEPLKATLEHLGVRRVTVGATRKVTLDLGILPDDFQIGQTGVSVNPRIMIAIGVSGAPQHLEYIGPRAVVFAFNKDPEAPLMVLNRTVPRPLVYPVLGDLFKEVPRFMRALQSSAVTGAHAVHHDEERTQEATS